MSTVRLLCGLESRSRSLSVERTERKGSVRKSRNSRLSSKVGTLVIQILSAGLEAGQHPALCINWFSGEFNPFASVSLPQKAILGASPSLGPLTKHNSPSNFTEIREVTVVP